MSDAVVQNPSAELVDALVTAYNDHDARTFAGRFAEDAVIYEHPGQLAQNGRDAIETFYRNRFQQLPQLHTCVIHRIEIGDYVIDHEQVDRGNDEPPFQTLAINLIVDGHIQRLDIVR